MAYSVLLYVQPGMRIILNELLYTHISRNPVAGELVLVFVRNAVPGVAQTGQQLYWAQQAAKSPVPAVMPQQASAAVQLVVTVVTAVGIVYIYKI